MIEVIRKVQFASTHWFSPPWSHEPTTCRSSLQRETNPATTELSGVLSGKDCPSGIVIQHCRRSDIGDLIINEDDGVVAPNEHGISLSLHHVRGFRLSIIIAELWIDYV